MAEWASFHSFQIVVGRVEVVVDTPKLVKELRAHWTLDVFGRREAKVNLQYYKLIS